MKRIKFNTPGLSLNPHQCCFNAIAVELFLVSVSIVFPVKRPQTHPVHRTSGLFAFRHPGLKLAFTAPAGFTMSNGTDAVTVAGQGGQATFSGGAFAGDFDSYIRSIFKGLAPNSNLEVGAARQFQVNGIDAASATVGATTQSGPVDVTVVAYAADAKTAYHFMLVTAQGSGVGPFQSLVGSLRRLSVPEAAAIKPRRVRVVTVRPSDTIASLAARMAYSTMQVERFRVLNALTPNAPLRSGQKIKLITFDR